MKNLILFVLLFLLLKGGLSQKLSLTDAEKSKIPTKTMQSSNASGFLSHNSFTKLNATNDGISAEGNINYSANPAWSFNLNISTPVTSKTQQVKPLTIGGLSDNSTLTIGTQFINWGNGFYYDQSKYNEAITKVGGNPSNFNYDDLTPSAQRRFDQISKIHWGASVFAGAKLGIEQQSFKYVADPVSFAEKNESKTAFKASLNAGILNQWGILALTFEHDDGYQADDPVNYYIPIAATGVLVEKSLSPGSPTRQKSEKLRFEYLSNGYYGPGLRINPNINVEFNQKLFSFEFPVYFFTADNERTNFNGGVYAGYVSDKDFKFHTDKNNFAFGVFIGANFTTLFQ